MIIMIMTRSCFHIAIGPESKKRVCLLEFARWRHRERSLPSPTACCPSQYIVLPADTRNTLKLSPMVTVESSFICKTADYIHQAPN